MALTHPSLRPNAAAAAAGGSDIAATATAGAAEAEAEAGGGAAVLMGARVRRRPQWFLTPRGSTG